MVKITFTVEDDEAEKMQIILADKHDLRDETPLSVLAEIVLRIEFEDAVKNMFDLKN